MNTNLVKAVLSAKFPQLGEKSLAGLAEVCIATGNTSVAIESILGVYEEPELPQQCEKYSRIYTLKKYKKYPQTIIATYEEPKRVQMSHDYDSDEIAQQEYNNGTFTEGTIKKSYIDTGDKIQREEQFTLEDWMRYCK